MTSDVELVQRTKQGDLPAFELLVKRYQKPIVRNCQKLTKDADDAEEAAQETFIHVYKRLNTFNTKKSFKPWIYRISTNICYDMLRKRNKQVELSWDPEDKKPSILETMMVQERIQWVTNAVKKLPRLYRGPIIGYYFQNLSYKHLADILHVSINTLKTRLRRGKMYLKDDLERGLI